MFYLALEGASELINQSADVSRDIAQGWDDIWTDTIVNAPSNEAYSLVVDGALWLALVSSIVWIMNWAPRFIRGQMLAHSAFYLIIPVLIFAGLANNGETLGNLSYGINRLIIYGNELVLQQEIGAISAEEAIQEMNLTNIAASQLRSQFNTCANLEPSTSGGTDPRKKCFEELQANIDDLEAQFQNDFCSGALDPICGGLDIFTDFRNALGEAISEANSEYNEASPNQFYARFMLTEVAKRTGSYILANTVKSSMDHILRAIQWGYMTMLMGGMFLLGLSAPFFVAASLIPFHPRTFWTWLIGFLSFGLAIFFYNILVGTTARLIVEAEATTLSQLQYAFMLGFFAPALSSGLAGWSAWAAAKNAGQNGAQLAAATTSSLISVVRFIR